MRDIDKTKGQLIDELVAMRQRIGELETSLGERKTVEEALRESDEKLNLMFESVTEGIAVTDLDGKIVQVNEAEVRMHGYAREEVVGQSAFEFIAEKDHARATENLRKTLEEGSIRNVQYTLLTKDGKEFEAELSAAVIRKASGTPVGFIAITRDITERKRASEARYRDLVEREKDIIYTLDTLGNITSANYAVRLLGYKPEQVVGKHFTELIPEERREETMGDFNY